MIVKNKGKQDTQTVFTADPMELILLHHEMQVWLRILQKKRIQTYLVFTSLTLLALSIFFPSPFVSVLTYINAIVVFSYLIFGVILTNKNDKEPIYKNKFLHGIQFPLTTDNVHDAANLSYTTYGGTLMMHGSSTFEEKPLETPVILDGNPVVGAYIEIHTENPQEGTVYRVMLENGHSIATDRESFHTITHTLYKDMNNNPTTIPVLTGRQNSIVWGYISDSTAATQRFQKAKKTKDKIVALKESLHTAEEALNHIGLYRLTTSEH